MKKYLVHIIWVIVAVVAFVGGMYYGKSTVPATGRGNFAGFASSTRAGFGGRGAGAAGGFVVGQVSALGTDSITVQLANGNSQVIFYSSSTPVTEPTEVSPSTLTTGTNVMVGGTQNSDGSFTAETIQVRPAAASATQ